MKIKSIFMALGVMALGGALLASCSSSDDEYDFPGIDHERIYFQDANQDLAGAVVKTPVGYVKSLAAELPIKVTKAAPQAITVSVAIDNSLVEKYNAENGTELLAADPSAIVFSQKSVTINAGAVAPEENITLSFADNAEQYLTSTDGYVIPIVITGSTSADYQTSTNMGTRFIVVNVKETALRILGEPGDILGAEITDYTSLTSTPDGIQGLWSGSSWNRRWNLGSNPAEAVIDLQQQRNITGVRVLCQYAQYAVWYPQWYAEYIPVGFSIAISNDGATFTELGSLTGTDEFFFDDEGYGNIVFYGGMPCRYIKLGVEFGYGSTLTGLKIYEN